MTSAISNLKQALREEARRNVKAIPLPSRLQLSQQAFEILQRQQVWLSVKSLLLYAPLKDELDLSGLLPQSLMKGREIFLPRYDESALEYGICPVSSLSALAPGTHGILEPRDSPFSACRKHLDFLLVPGLGFDLEGRRLGRGKGFYDRLLGRIEGPKCGVCFDEQIFQAIPSEPHDQKMDFLLTPTRWVECAREAR